MQTIKELQSLLNSKTKFEERYSRYKHKDDKIHLLYVSPCLNASGFYRMILPALEMNKTATHSAIITNIENWGFNKNFENYDTLIDERLLLWADYIIFPPVLSDISYLIKAIRALNPNIQLVMDLDYNYHEIPKTHPRSAKITSNHKEFLLVSLAQMDVVTGANIHLLDYYATLMEKKHEDSNVYMEYLPSLISRFGYEDTLPMPPRKSEVIRIGIIGKPSSAVLSLKEALQKISNTYKDKVEFIFFGWNKKHSETETLFKDIDYTIEKSVSFSNYFNVLHKLSLDIALLPAEKNMFNKHKSYTKFLELSVFGIPVIASINHSAKLVLKEGETGLLANTEAEWIEAIELLIKDSDYREQLSRNALKKVWRSHGFNIRNIELITDLFI